MITLGGLDLFYGKVKFGNSGLYLENVTTINSLKIIAACHLEVGNQDLYVCAYTRPRYQVRAYTGPLVLWYLEKC